MAVRNLWKGLSGGAGDNLTSDGLRLSVLEDFEQTGLAWIWASDADGVLSYLSPGAAEAMGLPLANLLGRPLATLFETDPEHPDTHSARPLGFQISAHNRIVDVTVRCALPEARTGRPVWLSLSGQPKVDLTGRFHGYRGSAKDISVEYQRQIEDSRLAEYDSLTGLYNRHRMHRRLESVLAAFKAAKRNCALMMLDLDRFKQVNDTMGHPAGDDLLRQVAERLRNIIGDRGEIGRLGGDEFQVIIPDVDDRGKLGELADKIIQIVSQPYPIDGKRAIIGTSVGIAIAPYDGQEVEELVRASDLALYSAKNGGRGQFRFYSSDLKDEEEERQLLLDDLREALESEQLELHYQPVVRIHDNHVVGMEALMRWEHEERGWVSPGMFIPVAEDSSLIGPLGDWALNRACADAAAWPDTVRVAVNVSARQFTTAGFVDVVADALQASGLDPDRLELELTESVFMGDSEATEETFRALKKIGVRLALDDFGTGYSSLSYLRSAPFDKLKVDKSFVDSCTQKDQNSAKIITAIIGLSKALGMETTVEGVEAFDQLEVVRSRGAELVQGWIFAKAMPQHQVLQNIRSGEFKIEPSGPDKHRPDRRSMFRRIGIIHGDHRYDAVIRDLSKTGAFVEGLVGVPLDTALVLDLGGGQLVVCKVLRSEGAQLGVEFETPLVSDGAGGLCTRHRVSPYALAAASLPVAGAPSHAPAALSAGASAPQFMQVQVGSGG
ncbi:EAL domain-containing protein [Altererythrobacter sp. TH136]|uniref:putative bifunctional diguanylate cyclase/phosphodiesterase n=1 Tax=Altererythrobacter sp. TH136 TaxID=2067415 RepID=UPI001162D52E|nr:EAL domain-containing protein [Altererythrobacter sp. TH136]QDM40205.1 EAL domain-containing protein [Altererythrobacter sp. TH136]